MATATYNVKSLSSTGYLVQLEQEEDTCLENYYCSLA